MRKCVRRAAISTRRSAASFATSSRRSRTTRSAWCSSPTVRLSFLRGPRAARSSCGSCPGRTAPRTSRPADNSFTPSGTLCGRSCERWTWRWKSPPSISSCTPCRCARRRTTSTTGTSSSSPCSRSRLDSSGPAGATSIPRHRRRQRASSGRRRSFREQPLRRVRGGALREDGRAGRRDRRPSPGAGRARARRDGHHPPLRRQRRAPVGPAGHRSARRGAVSQPERRRAHPRARSGGASAVPLPPESLVRPPRALRRGRQGLSRQPQAVCPSLRRIAGSGAAMELHTRRDPCPRLAGGAGAADRQARLGGETVAGPRPLRVHHPQHGVPGVFPREAMSELELPADLFNPDALEFYGKLNLMKAGLVFAEKLTTVSPTYAREIVHSNEVGAGLEGLLRHRQSDLTGIMNGVDYERWSPEKDPLIPQHYSPQDLSGKAACKAALQEEVGLDPAPGTMLCATIGRLAHQKGYDVLAETVPSMMERGSQLLLLGTGDE